MLHRLLSLKVIIVLIAICTSLLMSPIPKQIGFYKWLFSKFIPVIMYPAISDASIGILPCTIPTINDWGFTFSELYDNNRQYEKQNSLWGQTALVTGVESNSGSIGYEISLALARLGVSVTMVCRNKETCKNAALQIRNDDIVLRRSKERNNNLVGPGMAIKTMIVDLSSLKSVRKFCKQFLLETDDGDDIPMPLDMLFLNEEIFSHPTQSQSQSNDSVNNDGTTGSTSTSLLLSEDGIENLFATNVVGYHLMYKLLEPSLKRNDSLRKTPPRIVVTSSLMSYYPFQKQQHYPGNTNKIATDIQTLNSAVISTTTVDDDAIDAVAVDYDSKSLYAHTKLAQIYWTNELNDRLIMKEQEQEQVQEQDDENSNKANSIMYVNAVLMGAVNTNIWNTIDYDNTPFLNDVFKYIVDNFVRPIMWTPEEGALTLLYLGTNVQDLQTKNIRGKYYHSQSIEMNNPIFAPNDGSKETKLVQEKLWLFLDDLVADFL
ncbi:NAD(P)-binding protein [Fragilariopsis cylindrus CCMP1102]|uniref:NAD(P)-binding protein n=1 Tax=Fragilariopsis cylindrus CCMP1102 TaxID=635003 RepID=A0A1E7FZA3_9STRA|nr:NAD(P)-binding protein [Fragilariopsis cylindrus CCMP1102]|eukprot:OEU23476.1 NAD(P)-binding protein [Fragilariopsis cylindrus CCMP1102]